ncbi:hypothetical protein CLOP_g17747 [Closterium sp. NIES-67]|nr:hypothetical protein CLOP_g17747 [Closterium sp. NIES-67]
MAGGTDCSSTTRRHSSSGAEAAAAATAAALAAAGVLQGRRILVVDDTAVNLLVARRTLTRCGATVTTAGSGEDAVRRVAAALSAAGDARGGDEGGALDVVLMDLHMPGMDGFMATEAIRECEKAVARGAAASEAATEVAQTGMEVTVLPRLPIVALTADVDEAIAQHCLANGFDGILQKPIDPRLLSHRLLQIEQPRCLGLLQTDSHSIQ